MMVSMVLSLLLNSSIETYTWVSTGLFRGSWYLGVWNHYDGINGSLYLVTQKYRDLHVGEYRDILRELVSGSMEPL